MKNEFEIRGDVTAIFLNSSKHGRLETLIDTVDLPRSQEIPGSWGVRWDAETRSFYCQRSERATDNKTRSLHRWIMYEPDGMVVDHINHDTLDNRRNNLRIITNAENMQNRRMQKNNTSGYPGVTWHKPTRKWLARIKTNGRYKHLGLFPTKEEAVSVSREARMKWLPLNNEFDPARRG